MENSITVNLTPSFIKKDRVSLDLPIALGILEASGQIPPHSGEGWACLGELTLRGDVRYTPGLIPAILLAEKKGYQGAIIPKISLEDLRLLSQVAPRLKLVPVATLLEAAQFARDPAKFLLPSLGSDPNAGASPANGIPCRAQEPTRFQRRAQKVHCRHQQTDDAKYR